MYKQKARTIAGVLKKYHPRTHKRKLYRVSITALHGGKVSVLTRRHAISTRLALRAIKLAELQWKREREKWDGYKIAHINLSDTRYMVIDGVRWPKTW